MLSTVCHIPSTPSSLIPQCSSFIPYLFLLPLICHPSFLPYFSSLSFNPHLCPFRHPYLLSSKFLPHSSLSRNLLIRTLIHRVHFLHPQPGQLEPHSCSATKPFIHFVYPLKPSRGEGRGNCQQSIVMLSTYSICSDCH